MRRRTRVLASAAVAAALAGFSPPRVLGDDATVAVVPDVADGALRPAVAKILDALAPGDPAARLRAADQLSKLPWRDLVAALEQPGPDRDGSRGSALSDAIAFGGARVASEMLRVSASPSGTGPQRLAALRNAGRADVAAPIDDVVAAACAAGPLEREGVAHRAALRRAVAASLRRTPGDVRAAVGRWRELGGSARTAILDGIEDAGRDGGERALGAFLPYVADGHAPLLDRLSRAPFRRAEPLGLGVECDVDRCLDSPVPGVRAAAALVAGRIGGLERAERLRVLLTDKDLVVLTCAHRALEAASGGRLIANADLWKFRLDDERAWALKGAPEEIALLASEDPAVVCAALARVATRRLHATTLVPRVVDLLTTADSTVRRTACETLAKLGSPRAIPALLRALGESDPDTVAAASAALAAITSMAEPKDTATWHRELSADER